MSPTPATQRARTGGRRLRPAFLCIALLPLGFGAQWLAACLPGTTEALYSNGVFPALRGALTAGVSRSPGSVVEVWRFADLDADRVERPVDGPLCWYDDARYDLRLVHQDLAYWFWTPQGTPAHWLLTRLVEGRPSVLLAEGWEWGGREPPQFRAGCGLLTDAQVRRLVDGPAPKRTLRGLLDRWRRRGS